VKFVAELGENFIKSMAFPSINYFPPEIFNIQRNFSGHCIEHILILGLLHVLQLLHVLFPS